MNTLTLLIALLVPSTAFANDGLTLREHAALRAVNRLEQQTQQGLRVNVIRLGRNVRTRDMSMRRLVRSNEGTVTQVVDGSVIVVELENGTTESVRTLGAEAPLLHTGTDKEQCFALEAKAALEGLVLNKHVALERDRNYQRDHFGRLIRYVRLNSLDVNGWMIDSGFSFADDAVSHARYTNYQLRETEAREYERGLWGDYCTYNPLPRRLFEFLE